MRLLIIGAVVSGFCTGKLSAQDSSQLHSISSLPSSYYRQITHKIQEQEIYFDKGLAKSLQRIEYQEKKLYKKLFRKDSVRAKMLFGVATAKKEDVLKMARSRAAQIDKYNSVYNSKLDSFSTAISFLQKGKLIDTDATREAEKALQSMGSLQGRLDQANQVSKIVQERKNYLLGRMKELGMVKDLKKYSKEVYYYQQQFKEYKEVLNDPSKLEGKLLDIAVKIPAFRNFFNQHSALSGLFRLPSENGNSGIPLTGFQTTESIAQDMRNRYGNSADITQVMQQNVRSARQTFNEQQASQQAVAGNTVEDLPRFKPNSQKTKTFWKRIELGTDFQSQKSNQFFPVTSDVALSAGYKMNDRSVVGVGASYKIGWGENIQNINVSSQGAGVRSFLDWKIKGSFYFSGGFEMNYRSAFNQIQQLKDYTAWQQSGLLGLSKTVSLRSKFFKNTKLQLLWDFLSYQQIPKTQSILFRVGYKFKSFQ